MDNDFKTIEEAFEQTLSRTETEGNQMEAPLDMNSHQILNVPKPVEPTDLVRLQDIGELVLDLVTTEIEDIAENSGRDAGEAAGTISGAAAGTAAATTVLGTKAEVNGSNISQGPFRTALGLGSAALLNIGTTLNTVAAGNDSRIVNAAQTDLSNVLGATLGAKTIQVDGASVSLSIAQLLGLPKTPEHYGAVAGVFTTSQGATNRAAFTAAATAGVTLDGYNKIYALNGRWEPPTTGFSWRNIRIRQSAADDSSNWNRTIYQTGISNVSMYNVEIDQNNIAQTAGFNSCAGIWLANGSNIYMNNVRVVNGTAITGIRIHSCSKVLAIDVVAADFVSNHASEPSDDVMQGFLADGCSESNFVRCGGRDLTANWPGRPAVTWRRYSRGLSAGGNNLCNFDTPFGHRVDQGIDFTGSVGNSHCTVTNAVSYYPSYYGIKWANHNFTNSLIGGFVYRPGRVGFVCNSAAEMVGPDPQEIFASHITVIEPGFGGLYSNQRYGFSLISSTLGPQGYPAAIVLSHCRAIDKQSTKTMDYGFFSEAYVDRNSDSTIPLNRLINCQSRGHISGSIGKTGDAGWHFPYVVAKGNTTQTLTTNTLTTLNINTDILDPANMHTNGRLYAKVSGRYLVIASVSFGNNATGWRQLTLSKNGSEGNAAQPRATVPVSGSTDNTSVDLVRLINLNAGDYIELIGRHTAGVDLPVNLASAQFEMTLVQDLF